MTSINNISNHNIKNNRRVSTGAAPPKDQTARKIEAMEAQRLERRKAMQARKIQRQEENQRNIAAGNPGDVDFIGFVQLWREEHAHEALPLLPKQPRICVAVRKRPLSDKERAKCDHDSVTVLHPKVWVHAAKFRVDGITKYLDHSDHVFDFAFDETCETLQVYKYTTLPLLEFVFGNATTTTTSSSSSNTGSSMGGGVGSKSSSNKKCITPTGSGGAAGGGGGGNKATVFCYGQTGSGKTYTMQGIQTLLAQDLFALIQESDSQQQQNSLSKPAVATPSVTVAVSFYELYGGFVQDLLNDRRRLKVLEDGKGEVQVTGLTERDALDVETFLSVLEEGNAARTTHTTQANDTSSRSHAICQIVLRRQTAAGNSKTRSSSNNKNLIVGKLSLVDLAGSERGSDTTAHNAQRRTESAEINTSLLSLKECIRALGESSKHVPYRGSKLTLLLRDCFAGANTRTAMIATVSPGASAADHSVNTLRYADRIKEQRRTTSAASSNTSTTPPQSSTAKSLSNNTQLQRPLSPVRPVDRLSDNSHKSSGSSSSTTTATTTSTTTRQQGHSHQHDTSSKPATALSSSSSSSRNTRSTLNANVKPQTLAQSTKATNNTKTSCGKQQRPSQQQKQQPQQQVFPICDAGNGSDDEDDLDDLRPGNTPDKIDQTHDDNDDDDLDEDDLRVEQEDHHHEPQQSQQQNHHHHQHHQHDHHHHEDHHTDEEYYDCEDGEELDYFEDNNDSQGGRGGGGGDEVDLLKQEEEELLTVHMSSIQENAELLTEEGNLLQAVQGQDATLQDIQLYAEALESILDRKEDLILYLQSRLGALQEKMLQQQQQQQQQQ